MEDGNDIHIRVRELENRVGSLNADLQVFNKSVDNFDKVVTKLSCTLDDLGKLFIKLELNNQANSDNIKELKDDLKKNNEDHRLNLAQLVKQNIIPLAVLLVLIVQIIESSR